MEFTVNANTIIGVASLLTALGVIIGLIVNVIKQLNKWNSYDKKINEVKTKVNNLQKEQYLQIKTERAILDGLHQLGCNGQTTHAAQELDDFLIKKAHEIEPDV